MQAIVFTRHVEKQLILNMRNLTRSQCLALHASIHLSLPSNSIPKEFIWCWLEAIPLLQVIQTCEQMYTALLCVVTSVSTANIRKGSVSIHQVRNLISTVTNKSSEQTC